MSASSVIYLRQPRRMARLAVSHPGFQADAKAILEAPKEQILAIAAALRTRTTFASEGDVRSTVLAVVGDKDHAGKIANYIVNLHSIAHNSELEDTEFLEWFESQLNKHGEKHFSAEDRQRLVDLSREIVGDQPSLTLQQKALELAEATGRPLESFLAVCDLRPIFNDTRDTIHGLLPMVTLRLTTTDYSGMPICLETIVTPKQLDEIEAQITRAKIKLKTSQKLLAEKGIPVPELNEVEDELEADDDYEQ